MKVLIACEESQTECKALRAKGHEAYSCDIIEPSGGHPEWHIMQDVLPLINGNCEFTTCDGAVHKIDGKWDMIIAFPPCTDLAASGAAWFERKRENGQQRISVDFFCQFLVADCDRIAIENPVGIISGHYVQEYYPDLAAFYCLPRKPSQIINPWQYGHPEQKKTCLWLKNLPLLRETDNVYEYMMTLPEKERARIWWMGSNHAKERSKTYIGIAEAMAEQWG